MTDQELNKIATHPLQTSYWADFRERWGNEILKTKFGILTLHKIPHTKYKIGMFIKGPKPNNTMLLDLKQIGKDKNLIFIKMEPNTPKTPELVNLLLKNGAVSGKTLFTPTTFWVDLTPSENDIFSSFHSKTRYNIRVAQKNGVTVKEDNSDKAFKKYLELTEETVRRQGFFAHTSQYHELMWGILRKADIAHLFTATYKGEVITTWILFIWKNFLYYPYGASTEKYKNVMANNLMMWEAIKFGKKKSLQTFDLWGREEGKGFTKFKEGYSPNVIEFVGTWDLVINKPVYQIYKILDILRWSVLRMSARIGLSKHRF